MTQTIEDEKIYDLAEILFNYGGQQVRLVSSGGITVTYKIDTDDITDISSYYRAGTTTKKITFELEIKDVVNITKVRSLIAKAVVDKSAQISIGVYNKVPGQSPIIEDTFFDITPSEMKVEKKNGNKCDIKCSAGYSTIFNISDI